MHGGATSHLIVESLVDRPKLVRRKLFPPFAYPLLDKQDRPPVLEIDRHAYERPHGQKQEDARGGEDQIEDALAYRFCTKRSQRHPLIDMVLHHAFSAFLILPRRP